MRVIYDSSGLIAYGFIAFIGHRFDTSTLGACDAGADASGHGFDYAQKPLTFAAIATLIRADRLVRESESDPPDDF